MTLTATYNDDLARIQLVATGAPGTADYAVFERSTDQVTWTEVRGGQTVSLVSGGCTLDDYEFVPGVQNYYRVSYIDDGLLPSFIGAGTAVTGNNSSLAPAPPAGTAVGDLKLIYASIRNSGAGTVDLPTGGWVRVGGSGNVAVFGKLHASADTTPTVSFSGGVANADTLAQMAVFRDAELYPVGAQSQLNVSTQSIAGPTIVQEAGVYIQLGWKQDDMTSSTTPTFGTKIGDISSTAGDDASMCWFRFTLPRDNDGLTFNSWPITINGGTTAISRGLSLVFPVSANSGQDAASVTPDMNDVWLKNVLRPNLNRKVDPVGGIEISRKSRSGVFDIVGRTMPITVTDVRGSRQFDLRLFVGDYDERDGLDNTLATGDTMFLHVPDGGPSASAYVLVGDTSWSNLSQLYVLPLTEVAAPDGTLVGNTILWIDVIAEYPSWADLMADEPTWSDLVSQIAPGDSVIVP